MTTPKQRTSEILQEIADQCGAGHISVRDFTRLMGDRAFALVILIFSLPNSLPLPGIPGFSTLTGLPILFIGIQMVLGRNYIWLPRKVAEAHFSEPMLKKVLNKSIPWVIKLEVFLRPRWYVVCSPMGERLIGVFVLALASLLVLPVPGGNFLPGLSISLLALSFLEKDGMAASASMAFGIASIVLMFEFVKFALGKMGAWFTRMIG